MSLTSLAVVEADAADDPVGNVAVPKRFLDHAALGGGAVHHRDVVAATSLTPAQTPDLIDDELRFVVLIREFAHDDVLAVRVFRAERAVDPLPVFADDAVGGFDDRARSSGS